MKVLSEAGKFFGELVFRLLFGILKISLPLVRHPKLRARFVRMAGNLTSDALQSFDSSYALQISNKKGNPSPVCVSDGTLSLSIRGTDRYLKQSGSHGFEGTEHISTLDRFGVKQPKAIVDVGANFGEIALCFSARFPKAKIIAVEPSSANLLLMDENIARQSFDTSNIIVRRCAISDHHDSVELTRNLGSQNSIVVERNLPKTGYEVVPCKRLDDLFSEEKVSWCDFLKIDIEGAEPYLAESLSTVLDKVSVMLIEFSYKNTPAEYSKLVDVFQKAQSGWRCYDNRFLDQEIPLSEVISDFTGNGTIRKPYREYWFVRQEN